MILRLLDAYRHWRKVRAIRRLLREWRRNVDVLKEIETLDPDFKQAAIAYVNRTHQEGITKQLTG